MTPKAVSPEPEHKTPTQPWKPPGADRFQPKPKQKPARTTATSPKQEKKKKKRKRKGCDLLDDAAGLSGSDSGDEAEDDVETDADRAFRADEDDPFSAYDAAIDHRELNTMREIEEEKKTAAELERLSQTFAKQSINARLEEQEAELTMEFNAKHADLLRLNDKTKTKKSERTHKKQKTNHGKTSGS